jgi:hypothetical protein
MKKIVYTALASFTLIPSISNADESKCDWFSEVYRLVAISRDQGNSKSKSYLSLAQNQKSETMRDVFFDVVSQVYHPGMEKVTPTEFYAIAAKKCMTSRAELNEAKK